MKKSCNKVIRAIWMMAIALVMLFSVMTVSAAASPTVTGAGHMQKLGWRNKSGEIIGVTGQSLRMEEFRLNLSKKDATGDIQYRSYVQKSGWESSWKKNGATSGTTGKSLRIEAVQIKLTGNLAAKYDLYYRAHTEKFGWLGWAKNGASAGTGKYNYRIEAVQIKLVKKGASAPGSTSNAYRTKTTTTTTYERYWVTSNHFYHTTQNTLGHYKTIDAAKQAISKVASSTRDEWYVYDRTAKKMVYPVLTTNKQKIDFLVKWVKAIANDNKHVYSSVGELFADNMTLSTTAPLPARWGVYGNYSCSTLIEIGFEISGYTNLREICRKNNLRMNAYFGRRVGYNSTTMVKAMQLSRKFKEVTATYRSKGYGSLKPGDILFTSGEGHVAIYVGNNRCVEAVGSGIVTSTCGSRWGRVMRPTT
ncbi:MAG: hypothetical protein Q4B26_00330 [Eubacteriales bacterium]|nr:hypothetical protein [Eubacteriales bacterium]